MPVYEIWIKNDPALNGRDCQCHIATRATFEIRDDRNITLRKADRDLCELNLKRLRRNNAAYADKYEVREVASGSITAA
jgi:hypothetical protein